MSLIGYAEMNGKANLRRGELCSPENKGLSLVLDGRTQFAPTMSNENRSFLRSRSTPININLSISNFDLSVSCVYAIINDYTVGEGLDFISVIDIPHRETSIYRFQILIWR